MRKLLFLFITIICAGFLCACSQTELYVDKYKGVLLGCGGRE